MEKEIEWREKKKEEGESGRCRERERKREYRNLRVFPSASQFLWRGERTAMSLIGLMMGPDNTGLMNK